MDESVSMELRRKRARTMRAISVRLHNMKKMKINRLAPAATLKNRANKVARQMLRKKLAGKAGKNYASLNLSQKMAIDRMVDHAPKARLRAVAKRLLPFVTRAEHTRLATVRGHKELKESTSHKQRMHRAAAAERSAHKRKAGTGFGQNRHRINMKGLGRANNRQARTELLKQMGGQMTGNKLKDAGIRDILIDRKSRLSSIRSRSSARRFSSRGSRSDLARRSRKNFNRYDLQNRGFASLKNSYTVHDEFAELMAEGVINKKFEALFIRGLAARNKVEQYKRVFRNLSGNVRLVRYQSDITKMLKDLVQIITDDDTIYRRIRLILQKKGKTYG